MDNSTKVAKLRNTIRLYNEFARVEDHASLESLIKKNSTFVFDQEMSWSKNKIPNVDLEGGILTIISLLLR